MEEYLRSLAMTARIGPVTAMSLERTAQLINKSNQFNLTTRRRSAAEVSALAADPQWLTRTVSLTDRFGDNGLIGVLLAKIEGDDLVIDTWLMSCRVLETRRGDALEQQPLPLGRRPRAEANLRRVPSYIKERSGPRALCRTRIHQDLRRRHRADPLGTAAIGRLAAAAGFDRGAEFHE